MFSGRAAPPRAPVTLTLDGDPVTAERGEPIAQALLAADKSILARSPKLHRPRGPSCLRGACDGCLARVDGVPNVLTCLVPARGGERVESQNVVGARQTDLLRVTDWFFPKGIDHHHLMAGVPALGEAMQSFAQKVAGLGRMPAAATRAAEEQPRRDVDALVIGGGIAGMTVASSLARAGHGVALVDDGVELGGASIALKNRPVIALERVDVLGGRTAAGVFDAVDGGRDCLVADARAALLFRARAIVFATGAHDGVIAAENNDLPGVFSARALARLLARGLVPDGPVGVVDAGGAFWADELARAAKGVVRVDARELLGFAGRSGVTALKLKSGRKKVAVVGVDAPPAPAFELAAQAGAEIVHGPAGYRVVTDEAGRAAPGVFAAGECTGEAFDVVRLASRAAEVAEAVAASLR